MMVVTRVDEEMNKWLWQIKKADETRYHFVPQYEYS